MIKIQFQRLTTDGKPVTVESNLLNTAILEIEWIALVISANGLTLYEAQRYFVGPSSLKHIVPGVAG